ncbi:ABC transporter ATP-binding protein [Marinibaculum pumilum]|uniref:ABC transporter ATP-binding protein n=1 Tax=Marinibaculum pumilum TaxID=1766165 RepID=A0ABV7LAC4_9PROT
MQGLAAGYGKKRVLHGLDMDLNQGEILLVLGHNGAGKTTLLQTMFGLLRPMAGSIAFEGREIGGRTPAANVRDGIAFVPQGHGIFRSLTVRTNLELGAFAERDAARMPERLEAVFELFPILKERAQQIGGTMSGGQQQMLAIGMALMHGPRVLILDEPSIGLAPNLVERVMQSIRTVNERFGTTILMVEQNVKLSLPIASRAVVVKTGAVVYEGDPAPLTDHVRLMQLF